MTDDRITAFINSYDQGNVPYLNEMEQFARQNHVPIIRTQVQGLLKLLLAMKKPMRILEVGTAIGFSALFMSEHAPAGCEVVTIEKVEKRIGQAKENFRQYGQGNKITLLEGDAKEILSTLEIPFDFIFMDAAKGQYLCFLPHVLRLLREGGILVSDNVLQDGDVLESRYAVTRRNRTIHSRMREYLYQLTHREELYTSILPVGDGVTVSYKRY